MTRNTALTCLAFLLAFAPSLCDAQTPAPAPSFTISADPITMPSGGLGSIPFILTSVNGFTGPVNVMVTPPNPPVGVKEPSSTGGPATPPYVLSANAKTTGVVYITAAQPLPVHEISKLTLHGHGAYWTLAGVLMLGLGLQRRRDRRSNRLPARLLLVVGMLIGMTGIGACGGSIETLTPGVYAYTVTAYTASQSSTSISTSTIVNVTVPTGIIVQPTIGPGPV